MVNSHENFVVETESIRIYLKNTTYFLIYNVPMVIFQIFKK
jgi:hypothetical protein